jgi:serine/threonine protein phosphatase 1
MSVIKRFSKNTKGIDLVTGDIHGMFRKLETELYTIGFDESVDRLFSVGDLVDRGVDDQLFMEWLDKPWFHAVKGNHEILLEGTLQGVPELYQCHMANGGLWCLDFLDDVVWCDTTLGYLQKLPYVIEVETDNGLVGIIHADTGLQMDWEVFKQGVEENKHGYRESCVWGRDHINSKHTGVVKGVTTIYAGHSPVYSPEQHGNIVFIDTGACFKQGHFTILSL